MSLPTMIVESPYGRAQVNPSLWNAKTAQFSEGLPQRVTIKKGDSLFSLSKKYAVPIPLLIEKNKLTAPFMLHPGQKITIIGPRVHIVQKGENLYEIALKHNVSVYSLQQNNKLVDKNRPLETGQQIVLPAVIEEKSPEMTLAKPLNTTSQSLRKSDFLSLRKEVCHLEKERSPMRFLKPVEGIVISGFGPKKNGFFNDGVNVKAARGTPVKSAESGIVVYAGKGIKSYGTLVLIKHRLGWMTVYGHLGGFVVHKGQSLKKGDVLGFVGSTGFVKEPQLHFEVRKSFSQKPVGRLAQAVYT